VELRDDLPRATDGRLSIQFSKNSPLRFPLQKRSGKVAKLLRAGAGVGCKGVSNLPDDGGRRRTTLRIMSRVRTHYSRVPCFSVSAVTVWRPVRGCREFLEGTHHASLAWDFVLQNRCISLSRFDLLILFACHLAPFLISPDSASDGGVFSGRNAARQCQATGSGVRAAERFPVNYCSFAKYLVRLAVNTIPNPYRARSGGDENGRGAAADSFYDGRGSEPRS
jgi:hypothetical protein